MEIIAPYILLIWLHFIADFVTQIRYIADNKSKDKKILLLHCIIYAIPFMYFNVMFGIINGILHFVVDYLSSKATTYFYSKENYYGFFTIIGLDQAIHLTLLLLTFHLLT